MLAKDPKKRITVEEALNHPAFTKLGGALELSSKAKKSHLASIGFSEPAIGSEIPELRKSNPNLVSGTDYS